MCGMNIFLSLCISNRLSSKFFGLLLVIAVNDLLLYTKLHLNQNIISE